jgi:outer membrane protein TolC
LAALIGDLTGCSRLRDSAALNPYRYAPPTRAEPWQAAGPPAPLGGSDTISPASLSSSNRATLARLPGLDLSREAGKTNDLADLIDFAQRTNPETRAAWEQARAAAARLGLADSAYAPVLALLASGGYSLSDFPAPGGLLVSSGPSSSPVLSLEWTLLDFGRRRADFDAAAQQLLQANFQFNRIHQQLTYDVQRAFYTYDSSRAQLDAALATLKTAQTVEQAAALRMEHGLATRSEYLQTQQERARAEFDLQSVQRNVSDAWAFLAESLGVSPTVSFKVVELSALPMPTNLVQTVEFAVDRALRQRPDLAAQLAQLRAREAGVRRARAEFRPTIGLSGSGGGTMGSWSVTAAGVGSPTYGYADPQYGAFLTFSWTLFDGFTRRNKLREAQARRDEAEATLSSLELKALREVWQAYADCKASFLQYDFGVALLAASRDAYDAALTSYQNGLGTGIELLTAERDLARARTTLIESRAEVLTSSAALAFAAGDWSGGRAPQANTATGKEH